MSENGQRDQLVELAKRRGFFFRSAAAYGGVGGFYTFGPHGAALKGNVEDAWHERFSVEEGHMSVDAPTIMPEPVFEASGHLDGFDDLLVECPDCGESHRADHLVEDGTDHEEAEGMPIQEIEEVIASYELVCPTCGAGLAGQAVEAFNLMFETAIGPGDGQPGYLRPETAQGIFVEFPRLKEYARNSLPFGVSQIGRAYRNEISPRRSIIRVREFTQAELELFVDPEGDGPNLEDVAAVELPLYSVSAQADDDGTPTSMTVREAVDEGIVADAWIAYFLGIAARWYDSVGVDMDRFRFRQHQPGERAHYASDCWDAESEIDGNWIEIAGFAHRGDYDLRKHGEHADDRFTIFRQYDEPRVTERATVDPDMSFLGPEYGEDAAAIAEELERLVERDRGAFEGETVTIEYGSQTHEIPVEYTGYSEDEQQESGEHIIPHVIEPSFGIGRLVYTIMDHAYREDIVDGEPRSYLAFPPTVAPTVVGVFPLQSDDDLEQQARSIAADLRSAGLSVTYDDAGNIGRRYRRQDEIGTPFCVTVDYESLEDDAVTVRDRDSTEQVRIPIADLPETLSALRAGDLEFDDLEEDG